MQLINALKYFLIVLVSTVLSLNPRIIYSFSFRGSPLAAAAVSLPDYLAECKAVGAVRFVVIGQGAILETVGSFDNLRFSDGPKGKLATLSTDNPCFECHIRCNEIKQAKQVIIEKFGKTLRVIRFNGGDENKTTHLSAILHGGSDEATRHFDGLVTKYGDQLTFE